MWGDLSRYHLPTCLPLDKPGKSFTGRQLPASLSLTVKMNSSKNMNEMKNPKSEKRLIIKDSDDKC